MQVSVVVDRDHFVSPRVRTAPDVLLPASSMPEDAKAIDQLPICALDDPKDHACKIRAKDRVTMQPSLVAEEAIVAAIQKAETNWKE